LKRRTGDFAGTKTPCSMGLIDRLGLRRKSRPVGDRLESGFRNLTADRRRAVFGKAALFLMLAVLTLVAFRVDESYRFAAEVGDTWTRDDIVSPYSFSINRDQTDVELERRRVRYTTPPLFRAIEDAGIIIDARRDTIANQLGAMFEAYGSFRMKQARGLSAEAAADSQRYMTLRRNALLKATPQQWGLLLDAYAARTPGLEATRRSQAVGPRLDFQLLDEAWRTARSLSDEGVTDIPLDSVHTDRIVVRDLRANSDRQILKSSIRGIDETYMAADQRFAAAHPGDATAAAIAGALFRALFQYSYSFMERESRERWSIEEERVSPTEGVVVDGEVIVRTGDRVTDLVKRKLNSLERAQATRTGDRIGWKTRLGQATVTLATLFFFFLYLFFLRRGIFESNRLLLVVTLLFAIIIGLYAFALRTDFFGMYIVPVAIVSILLTVIFDSRVGLFGTLTLALIGGLLLRYDFEFLFATIFATALGIYSVRDIKNRGQFFVSAGLVFSGYALILAGSLLLNNTTTDNFLGDLLQVGVNSFLLIIAYPLLWVFERTFDITTDLTLLELSDTNRPLLKELSLKAPGTLNHTLQVANLAEAAADRVGANALLARVGALYHDIGKMNKPEYYVENQRAGVNPHDQLKPRMSALIIASHVKDGLEIGRQHNLPQRVLDFIPMHHGTSLIEYFYRRALDAKGDGDSVSQSEFRYPGPKPDSRETGILMLADSVEAASRSLEAPTHKRLEGLIDTLFKARMDDGQLDNVDLTLRELNVIKETLLSMLVGMHHVRVKYPGQEEDGDGQPADELQAEPRDDAVERSEVAEGTATDTTKHDPYDDIVRRME